jgi:hypothetical protein
VPKKKMKMKQRPPPIDGKSEQLMHHKRIRSLMPTPAVIMKMSYGKMQEEADRDDGSYGESF